MTLVVQMQDTGTTAANDPLLSYTITTTPSPLKASPENPDSPEETGEIVIAVARQSGTPADVKSIRVKVPAGTMSPDLTTDLAKITERITLDGWSSHLDAAAKEFVFTPAASHTPIGPETGFTIQLSDIPMSRKVGTAPITLTESSRTGNAAFQDRTIIFNLGKFPADFYLRNFLCEPSIINNGDDVKLTWERSANATYDLLYPGVERDVTNRTSLELEGIKSDTTFYIRATTGDPTNPVTRILTTQVTVIKPDLEVGQLIVNGTITAKGDVNIAKEKTLTLNNLAPAEGVGINVGANLAIAANKALTANHIRATTNTADAVLFQGALTVTGNVLAQSHVTVTESGKVLRVRELRGPVKQAGETSDPPINISNGEIKVGTIHGTGTYPTVSIPAHVHLSTSGRTTTINGDVIVNGAVGSGGRGGELGVPGEVKFTAQTSGIVVGMAQSGSRYNSCKVTISGGVGGDVRSTACADNDPKSQHHVQMSSATAFVRKGATVTVKAERQTSSDSSWNYLYAYYRWIPFGNVTSVAELDGSPESLE